MGRSTCYLSRAAVNDLHVGQPPAQVSRAYEGVVRQVRETSPRCDIVLMHFAEPRHTEDYKNGKEPWVIERHEAVANQYGIVSVNMALEVHDRLIAGQFDWASDFKNLHPSPFGQRLYFQSIKRLLDSTWIDAADEQPEARSHEAPGFLNPGAYSRGSLVQPEEVHLNGFSIDPKWRVAGREVSQALCGCTHVGG